MPNGLVNVAFDDTVLEASPTWTRLDPTYRIQSITIRRGRSFELDTINTGTATVRLVDTTGAFDPNYTGGTFYGKTDPYKQIAIGLPDAAGTSWSTVFRGYVARWEYDLYQTEKVAFVTIECVDVLDLLSGAEMASDGTYGDSVTPAGDIVFDSDSSLDAVQTRITNVLNQTAVAMAYPSWPVGLRNIFTGNVGLLQRTYTSRTSPLTVIHEAAEAEFPGGVASFYAAKDGVARFRGRYARFDYTNPQYSVNQWAVGDDTAANASPSTVVRISPPFVFSRDKENVYTSASFAPQSTEAGVTLADADRAGNVVYDDAAAATYGLRTIAGEDLATRNGAGGTTALEETKLFADYYVANYAQPRIRVGALTVRPQSPTGIYGDSTWALFRGIELGDYLTLSVAPTWGGGFANEPYFVEGLSYDMKPMADAVHPEVTLTMDVSPATYWTSNPFAGP